MSAGLTNLDPPEAAMLALYLGLPETPLRTTPSDRATARLWLQQGLTLDLIEAALLLGSLRRLFRDPSLPRLAPIRSLAYFRPVVEELQAQPLPASYLDYLRLKLRQATSPSRPNAQKTTFSDER
jgi:hypothetical protein